MKYKLIARVNPQNKAAAPKYYAAPVYAGEKTLKELSREIADLSSLSPGDVYNVLVNLVTLLPKHTRDGFKVSLGDFGSFKASFSSEGVDDATKFNVSAIRGKKVLYRAGKDVRKGLDDMKLTQE
ncbi:MAG: HU family DNA-binding protein [Bacteroidales bacterium]|jgi:predicted histone-like DNA-binding protein|nr:HU family DNA-binding protein [Bacteroidales bacterium]